MKFTRIKLENWRNFRSIDIPLRRRAFLVGPNASGKSNLLDAFRFLRDIADPQGGFQSAVKDRGGVSQIRSLHARQNPNVAVEVEVDINGGASWSYRIEFSQNNLRRPEIRREIVRHSGDTVCDRPGQQDKEDPSRLSQTYMEQVSANKDFRVLADSFAQVRYLHLVPQLVRETDRWAGSEGDPYGGDFLEQMHKTQKKIRDSRLRRIRDALRVAVPQLKELVLEKDERGVPHLKGLYEHWRPNAGWQAEDQFSDGTLRLLGLLWILLDGSAPLLLEEPELSLHAAVIRHIPQMMAQLGRKVGRQILVSSHSADLLSDEGIPPEEVLLLIPTKEGTEVSLAASDQQIKALLEGGVSMGEAVIPRTAPKNAQQLSLFGA